MYDLILKGGRIYDGSGLPSFNGDVAIRDGKIAAIGRISEAAERVLDVGGLATALARDQAVRPYDGAEA